MIGFIRGYVTALAVGFVLVALFGEAGVFIVIAISVWMLWRVCARR